MNKSPVPSPVNQPFCFDFAPEMSPPINNARNETIKIIQENEVSVSDENDKISEITRLKDNAINKTVINPYSIAGNKPLCVNFSPPLSKLGQSLITIAYSRLFKIESFCVKKNKHDWDIPLIGW